MNPKEWYHINDFDDFVNSSRRLVFKFFGETNTIASDNLTATLSAMSNAEIEELETTLTYTETSLIIKNHAKVRVNKKTKKEKYYINEKILQSIIEDLNTRMVSNILNKLVSQNILDSAYDSEINDFVFWVKDDQQNTNNKEDPETN